MGYTITANNSNYDFSGGYGQFKSLRENIALAFDKEFGLHYQTLGLCHSKDTIKLFNDKANKILSDERFKDEDEDIIAFLFAPDCDGSISLKPVKRFMN